MHGVETASANVHKREKNINAAGWCPRYDDVPQLPFAGRTADNAKYDTPEKPTPPLPYDGS